MIATVTHRASESLQNNVDTGNKMIFHKSNFNMPVKNLWSDTSNWVRYAGPINYTGTATSFNLSDFSPGFEIAGFSSVYDWDNNTASSYTVDCYVYQKFYDTDGTTVLYNGVDGYNLVITLPAYSWTSTQFAFTQGVASWEVDQSSTYYIKGWATGDGAIGVTTQNISFTNVPSVTQLASSTVGHVWVEGNNLCFINSNRWKHTMVGTQVSTSPGTSKAGFLWIDGTDLHWVGANGYDYKASWKIKQFASSFSNGATGATFAGTSKYGFLWVDSEFGYTHLAYIASDGYKYLTGAGIDPYA